MHILNHTYSRAWTRKLFVLENRGKESIGVGNDVDARVWKDTSVQA